MQPNAEKITRLEALISTLHRRQRVLESQRTHFGEGVVPPQIVLELEDIERELLHHTAELRRLRPAPIDTDNPYLGLLTFQETDAERFFGRDVLVADLVARAGKTSFLAVLGASGSGKSSVVRAGLVPMLKGGGLEGSDRWRYITLRPGARPLDALAAELARLQGDPTQAARYRSALDEGDRALLLIAEALLDRAARPGATRNGLSASIALSGGHCSCHFPIRMINRRVWYTDQVLIELQQVSRRLLGRAPYPLALQSLISLVLLATLPSVFAETGYALSPRFGLLCIVIGLDVVLCWIVPVQRLQTWRQLAYLFLQLGAASLAHLLMPSQLLGYVYLVVVLQAVYLFKPLLWAVFAAGAYIIWSGSLIIASTSLFDWTRENLTLAFPMFCILIAAIVYARQHKRYDQMQLLLHQMQRRYDTLMLYLRDAQQHAAIEERHQLAQTIARDITAALAQVEQSVASAISQAQTNLPRLGTTIAQTRVAAASAIERLRTAVATLRLNTHDECAPQSHSQILAPLPAELMTLRSQRTLTWALPLTFAAIVLPLTLLQHPVTPALVLLFLLCCTALIGGYIFTQRIRNPVLIQLGLAEQVAAVLGMVVTTQALPLSFGLLLVIWQMALRLSIGQMAAFLIALQTVVGLALARVFPVPQVDWTQALIFAVACAGVIGLVGPARRQLSRRRKVEAHVAQLGNLMEELEQQVAQVSALGKAFERTRVAREIHDDLGHHLVLLNIQLQLVDDLIGEDPAAALDELISTREQLHKTWSSVFSTADRDLALDGSGLTPALNWLVGQCRALTAMEITLRMIGNLADMESAPACLIYRAVQEGLTNTCKYARARTTDVLVYCDDVVIQVRVRDDGCANGPALAKYAVPNVSGHFGLIGLRERAELLGGSVEAGPLPEGGFELRVTIPIA